MVPKDKNVLLQWQQIFTLSFALLGICVFTPVAVGAPPNTLETSREIEQPEPSAAAPGRVTVARVQSAAQKTVQEEVLQEKGSGAAPPSDAKSGGRIKKVRPVTVSSAPDKNEMRQVRGTSAIQEDDSLSAGSSGKGKASTGKSSAKKEDSFD